MTKQAYSTALCNGAVAVSGAELPATTCKVVLNGKEPPEWVELIPAGPAVNAVDGRSFLNTNPQKVVDLFNADANDIPIDYEHSSQIRAVKGESAPAAGWITGLEVRDGAVWGQVEWTGLGADSLKAREYRYISPAFLHDDNGVVMQMVSAGLTNLPALRLAELAHVNPTQGERKMDPKLLKLLGLDESATAEQVSAAVAALVNGATEAKDAVEAELAAARADLKVATAQAVAPSLQEFVPRATHDVATARVTELEVEIADRDKAAHDVKVTATIEAATKAGKITPPTVDYYTTQCSTAEGLKQFEEFVALASAVVDPKEVVQGTPPAAQDLEPTSIELAVAHSCGMTVEQMRAAK